MAAQDLARRIDSVQQRHGDVENADVGLELRRQPDGLPAVAGLANHFPVYLFLKDFAEAFSDECVVVPEKDADSRPLTMAFAASASAGSSVASPTE